MVVRETFWKLLVNQVVTLINSKMAEELKSKVLQDLGSLTEEQLETLCESQGLTVPANGKRSRRVSLKNALVRFLSSEQIEEKEDEGLEVFTQINEEIEKMLEPKKPDVKLEIHLEQSKTTTAGGGGSRMSRQEEILKQMADEEEAKLNTPSRVGKKLEFTKLKLKEFKICGGSIGAADTAGSVDWNSLQYQIKEGLELGYGKREIMSGVIKAIKTGSSLRKYFEGKSSLSWESFMGILKAHCNVVTASALLDKMGVSYQEPSENALDYVLRMMNLRDTVMESRTADDPIGTPHIKKKFTRALDVGLRSPTVRLELKPVIFDVGVTDDDLVEEVTKVMSRKTESDKKLGKGKTASVKAVGKDEDEKKQDKLFAQLAQLTAIVAENQQYMQDMDRRISSWTGGGDNFLASVAASNLSYRERRQESGQFNNNDGNSGNNGGNRDRNNNNRRKPFHFPKCNNCEKEKLFCNHCSICGADDHKRRTCSKNTH